MPEKKHRNPFEDHINSETFNMSDMSEVPAQSHVSSEIQDFLDKLPQPLGYDLWEHELDDRQKLLCEYLTDELVENVMRVHYAEELQDLSDSQLSEILIVPIALAMLAEEQLHEKAKPSKPILPEVNISSLDHPNAFADDSPHDFSALREMLRMGFLRVRDFFQRLFQKRYK